jgi:hypothetical protein
MYNILILRTICQIIKANGLALGAVADFGTDYFLLKIIFLAKREREFTTKFAIAPNVC